MSTTKSSRKSKSTCLSLTNPTVKLARRALSTTLKGTLCASALAAALPAAAALADDQAVHFQILDSSFQGDCGAVTPILNMLHGNPTIDFLFPDLAVLADATATHTRKLCNVRLHIGLDDGYRIGLGEVFFQGKADIDPVSGSGNVSARAFLIGLPGVDGFQHFDHGFSNNFEVDATAGTPNFTACGGDTYLNLLVDLSAHTAVNASYTSEIAIHRGAITPEFVGHQADVQCAVRQRSCR